MRRRLKKILIQITRHLDARTISATNSHFYIPFYIPGCVRCKKNKFYYIMNIYKPRSGDISWRSSVTRGRTGSFSDRWTGIRQFSFRRAFRFQVQSPTKPRCSSAADRSWRNATQRERGRHACSSAHAWEITSNRGNTSRSCIKIDRIGNSLEGGYRLVVVSTTCLLMGHDERVSMLSCAISNPTFRSCAENL